MVFWQFILSWHAACRFYSIPWGSQLFFFFCCFFFKELILFVVQPFGKAENSQKSLQNLLRDVLVGSLSLFFPFFFSFFFYFFNFGISFCCCCCCFCVIIIPRFYYLLSFSFLCVHLPHLNRN